MNVDEVIAEHWHRDGPHSVESVASAALAVDALLHYLARATWDQATMPRGGDIYRVVGELRSGLGRLDQVLEQMGRHAYALSSDPGLYDDRRDGRDPRRTAKEAAAHLGRVREGLSGVLADLDAAHSAVAHLGSDQ